MLSNIKIIFTIMMAVTLAVALKVQNPITETTPPSLSTTQPMDVMMTQMTDIPSDSNHDGAYHYICKVGVAKTENLMCHAADTQIWTRPHNVSMKLRCPKEGTGNLIAYAEVEVYITSQEMQCQIIGGGISQGYIELLVNTFNTKFIKYESTIYSI